MNKKNIVIFVLALLFMLPTNVKAASNATATDRINPIEHALAENPSERVFYFNNTRASSGPIDIAGYQDWDFTDISAEEPLLLQNDADTITVYAVCEGDVADKLVLHIEDWNGTGYDVALPFDADGSYTTFDWSISAGRYRLYIVGNSKILKTHAMVVFSKLDTSILGK